MNTSRETLYEPTDDDLKVYKSILGKEDSDNENNYSFLLRCNVCKSTNLNIFGDCCMSCGASISDPFNEYTEEASF